MCRGRDNALLTRGNWQGLLHCYTDLGHGGEVPPAELRAGVDAVELCLTGESAEAKLRPCLRDAGCGRRAEVSGHPARNKLRYATRRQEVKPSGRSQF